LLLVGCGSSSSSGTDLYIFFLMKHVVACGGDGENCTIMSKN
jgi:hypothetical protein